MANKLHETLASQVVNEEEMVRPRVHFINSVPACMLGVHKSLCYVALARMGYHFFCPLLCCVCVTLQSHPLLALHTASHRAHNKSQVGRHLVARVRGTSNGEQAGSVPG